MKSFFENLFGRKQVPPRIEKRPEVARHNVPERKELELYKKGDVIRGKYEVRGIAGKGGFGVVYLAYNREQNALCALKTFHDTMLTDRVAREAFEREIRIWVNLEDHPCVVAARWVEQVQGRFFVQMDYIAADAQKRISLHDHLSHAGGSLDLGQALTWAIHFCLGMEHANAHGIECHRDIKPANILIAQDGTLKVSDFGLAKAAEAAWFAVGRKGGSPVWRRDGENIGFSMWESDGKARCGTPGYMSPEVYRGERADMRSDIYSFGLVLWQMATGDRMPPFKARWRGNMEFFLTEIYKQQMSGRVLNVNNPLGPVIERCLKPNPSERYASFWELRGVLELLWTRAMGTRFEIPQTSEKSAAFWNNKGGSLHALFRYEEAVGCYDKALAIDPKSAMTWCNKGTALDCLGFHEKAITCLDRALAIDELLGLAWKSKADALAHLGHCEEAIHCFNKALAIEPRDSNAWSRKGLFFVTQKRHEDAIQCFDAALVIDRKSMVAWCSKGTALRCLGRYDEAIKCYESGLAIEPLDMADSRKRV